MSFNTYGTLSTALGTWGRRTYTTAQTDEFIALTEAAANRKLRQDFRRATSTTITTNSSGVAALPSGFVGMVSIVRDVAGSVPLKQVSWDSLIIRNPYEDSDDAQVYAIQGTMLQVAPIVEDDFTAIFSSTLTPLSSTNTTNWLLTLAPDFYLFYGRAMSMAYHEQWAEAQGLKADALMILDDLVSQGNVAAFGNAEMTMDMVTP